MPTTFACPRCGFDGPGAEGSGTHNCRAPDGRGPILQPERPTIGPPASFRLADGTVVTLRDTVFYDYGDLSRAGVLDRISKGLPPDGL